MKSIALVGLDVHKATTTICLVAATDGTPIDRFVIPTEFSAFRKYFTRWSALYDLACYYEAGGVGYTIYRWLTELGIPCRVVAPSSIPRASGDRIKTDRRDARKLVNQVRAGEVSFVHVPTPAEEAVRSVCRCRETLNRSVRTFRQKIAAFCLARGLRYPGTGKPWSQRHRQWLQTLTCAEAHDTWTLQEYRADLAYLEQRLADADQRLTALATAATYRPLAGAFQCFRGIKGLTAMALIAETIDFTRFPAAPSLMKFFGLVPSENTSSDRRRQGSITKVGNPHCRRLLVEAAWHYRHKPACGVELTKRQLGQPPELVALAWKAQHRLYARFVRLIAQGVPRPVAAVAVARELVGFLWAAARRVQQLGSAG